MQFDKDEKLIYINKKIKHLSGIINLDLDIDNYKDKLDKCNFSHIVQHKKKQALIRNELEKISSGQDWYLTKKFP